MEQTCLLSHMSTPSFIPPSLLPSIQLLFWRNWLFFLWGLWGSLETMRRQEGTQPLLGPEVLVAAWGPLFPFLLSCLFLGVKTWWLVQMPNWKSSCHMAFWDPRPSCFLGCRVSVSSSDWLWARHQVCWEVLREPRPVPWVLATAGIWISQ